MCALYDFQELNQTNLRYFGLRQCTVPCLPLIILTFTSRPGKTLEVRHSCRPIMIKTGRLRITDPEPREKR